MATTPNPPSLCPVCGGRRVASILYGLPDFTPELEASWMRAVWFWAAAACSGTTRSGAAAIVGHHWGRWEWPEPPVEVSV